MAVHFRGIHDISCSARARPTTVTHTRRTPSRRILGLTACLCTFPLHGDGVLPVAPFAAALAFFMAVFLILEDTGFGEFQDTLRGFMGLIVAVGVVAAVPLVFDLPFCHKSDDDDVVTFHSQPVPARPVSTVSKV